MKEGQSQITAGLGVFGDKITEAKTGSNQLRTGGVALEKGIRQLADGSVALENGSVKLADGADQN
ncbi:MAG: hypothetical protein ACQEWV_16075 [Bacillota bacterium]